ncbi:hypothetical protein D3C71_1850070 [compost metagenome]
MFCNYILYGSPLDGAYRYHRRVQRIYRAADNSLELHHECRTCYYAVNRCMGHASVPALSFHIYKELIG